MTRSLQERQMGWFVENKPYLFSISAMHWLVCQILFHSTQTRRRRHLLVIIIAHRQQAGTCSTDSQRASIQACWLNLALKQSEWTQRVSPTLCNTAPWLSMCWLISRFQWITASFPFVKHYILWNTEGGDPVACVPYESFRTRIRVSVLGGGLNTDPPQVFVITMPLCAYVGMCVNERNNAVP